MSNSTPSKHSRSIDPTLIGSPNTRPTSVPRSGEHTLSTYVETLMYFDRIHYEWAWMLGWILLVLVWAWAWLLWLRHGDANDEGSTKALTLQLL